MSKNTKSNRVKHVFVARPIVAGHETTHGNTVVKGEAYNLTAFLDALYDFAMPDVTYRVYQQATRKRREFLTEYIRKSNKALQSA